MRSWPARNSEGRIKIGDKYAVSWRNILSDVVNPCTILGKVLRKPDSYKRTYEEIYHQYYVGQKPHACAILVTISLLD